MLEAVILSDDKPRSTELLFLRAVLFPTAARRKNYARVVNSWHFIPMHPQIEETDVRTLTGKSANKSFGGLKSSHYREILRQFAVIHFSRVDNATIILTEH